MKVRCIRNSGADLRPFEYQLINDKEVFGRFGSSEITKYNIEIDTEYLVMGIIVFESYQAYLVDDSGLIIVCPCQLFDITDSKLSSNWNFRVIDKGEDIYPFVQVIFGYPELCSDIKAYDNLILEMEESAQQIYFKRKMELEKELMDL